MQTWFGVAEPGSRVRLGDGPRENLANEIRERVGDVLPVTTGKLVVTA